MPLVFLLSRVIVKIFRIDAGLDFLGCGRTFDTALRVHDFNLPQALSEPGRVCLCLGGRCKLIEFVRIEDGTL
jgi:hypothetical protein